MVLDNKSENTVRQAMLAAKKDAASSDAVIDPSNPIIEPESVEEDDDEWVIVETRKITILIPPAPPVCPQSKSPEMKRRVVKRSSQTLKRRRGKVFTGEVRKPAETPGFVTNMYGVGTNPEESNQNHAAPHGNETHEACDRNHFNGKPKSRHLPSAHVDGDGNAAALGKRRFVSSNASGCAARPPVGRLSVVNQRLRATNLERKLQGLGGLRTWLLSQGLSRFARVFEREGLGKYQLANLSMSKLKDMGTDAVGPRRKLIHAIDRLCQPYFFETTQ